MARGDDLGITRIVGAKKVFAEFCYARLGIFKQPNRGTYHLTQIVRRYIGCHANGDTCSAVEQQMGDARRQASRLFESAIKVGYPIDCALIDLGQE
jgi:hypothetical protein